MRTLVIMRHARAESSAPSDVERALTDDGHAAATEAGEWLAAQGIDPADGLVSVAERTQQTWEDVCLGAGWDLDLARTSDALYEATSQSALDLIRETDDGVTATILVGHNPTVASLVQLLDDGRGDEEVGNRVALGFPPASVAVFRLDQSWAELEEADARLVAFHIGDG